MINICFVSVYKKVEFSVFYDFFFLFTCFHNDDHESLFVKFETYFVLNQEVLIRRFATARDGSRIESCRARFAGCERGSFKLTLLSSAQDIMFTEGEFLELHSDRFELGVRLTGICSRISGRQLQFEANDDLELFYRRKYWRISLPVWHGTLRLSQSKRPLYEVWEMAQILRDENDLDPSIQVEIARRTLNLSAGGVRMELAEPVNLYEICLLYICLDDGKPTICALCEVVRVEPCESDLVRLCGLRFCNLLESDLKRIDRFVTQNCRFDPSCDGTVIEQSHTV
jgi:hypothetical protein